jgi:dihydrofolate reductase/thymidylate synthase
MNLYNKQYLDLLEEILNEGIEAPCRTGNKVLVKLNKSLTWDLNEGFPICTFRQIPFKGVKGELSCFLDGITDKKVFQERGCNYWNSWCNPKKVPYTDKKGMEAESDLGNVYGYNWLHFGAEYIDQNADYTDKGTNQVKQVVETLRKNPYDRRMIITAWDPAHIDTMGLPPCLHTWQFNYLGNKLHLTGLQRSADMLLGVPADIIQGSLLLHLMAQTVGMQVGTITLEFANCHIYDNHIDITKEHLEKWRKCNIPLPKLMLDSNATVFNFMPDMAKLDNYQFEEKVKFDIAV